MRAGETYEILYHGDKYTIEIESIKENGDIRAGFTVDKYPLTTDGTFYLRNISYMKLIDPPYKWPAGVSKGAYMAMDANGEWHIFNQKPYLDNRTSSSDWVYVEGSFAYPISELRFKNPPTPSDWKQSLIRNV